MDPATFAPILVLGATTVISLILVAVLIVKRRQPSVDEAHIRQLTEAETQIQYLEKRLSEAQEEIKDQRQRNEKAQAEIAQARQETALARQQEAETRKRLADWEEFRKQAESAAKAATLSSAAELSNKLLADHKRESDASKEASEKRIQETTKKLNEQFENVVKSVAALDSQVKISGQTMDVIHRALSAPSSAGHAAETVLENTLKAFGMTEGRDYSLQHTVDGEDGRRLRPDALVFLPGDCLLVIDAKASKHLLALAEAEANNEDLDAAHAELKTSMNKHLRDLTTRDYSNAIRQQFRELQHEGEPKQVTTFMFLPNDGAVEKLLSADPQIAQKAAAGDIILGGPSSLWAAVGVASMRLKFAKQQENQQRIVEEVEKLIGAIATMTENGVRVGNGLKTALTAFDKMAGSINGNVIPKARKLVQMGVPQPSKGLNTKFPRLTVQTDAIEADSESVTDDADFPLLERSEN